MKSAQVMAGAAVGGAELFYERLCTALHQSGDAVLPVIRRAPDRAYRLRRAGLAPHQLRFGNHEIATRLRLGAYLRRESPEVVVAWMGRAAAATPRGPWTLVGRLGGNYDLRRFRRCRHLVGNTRAIADWIIAEGWPADRVHHLPNFVPDLLGATPADRLHLAVPPEAPLILALGRLHPVKGFDLLIRAVAALPGAHLVIAGAGTEDAALAALAAELRIADRVHLPGWRTDTDSLLAACDVFVCPSRSEPLGNAVLEAWSAARPVIATEAEGPRALIRAGIDGLLVKLADPAALTQAIAALLADRTRAAAIAAAGRARYLEGFGEAEVVGAWRQFLRSVAP
jgi:glycosyltransferase involved in cell wall biosynthesis